jgi:hypothetical protein
MTRKPKHTEATPKLQQRAGGNKTPLRLVTNADDQWGVLVDVGAKRITGLGMAQVIFGGWQPALAMAQAMLLPLQYKFPGAFCWLCSKGTPQPKEDINAYGVLLHEQVDDDDRYGWDGWYSAPQMAQARVAVLQQRYPDHVCWLVEKINASDEVLESAMASHPKGRQ